MTAKRTAKTAAKTPARTQKKRTVKADEIQPGDVIQVRGGIAGTVTHRCPPPNGAADIVCLWWRADGDDPEKPSHRMAPRVLDEDVTLLRRPEPEAHDVALD